MGLLEMMNNQLVYIDAAPFIYFMERNPLYNEPLDVFFSLLNQGKVRAVTSIITLTEVLIKPYRAKQWMLAKKYESIFQETSDLVLLSADAEVGRLAAQLRASYALMTPDAIHLATAKIHRADFFLTNDSDFRKVDPTDQRLPKIVFIDEL